MRALPALWCLSSLLAACGGPTSECLCTVNTATGNVPIACGASFCAGATGYRCSATGEAFSAPEVCPTVGPTCTPRTCPASACGDLPDGCGGALHCGGCSTGNQCNASNVCEPVCAHVTCSGGQRCDPANGACVADACTQAGAVCGSINGTVCGTCPAGSTCAGTKQVCVQQLATLPLSTSSYVLSTALLGDFLYVSASAASGPAAALYEVTLSSGQTRLVPGAIRSPLTQNGAELFWTDEQGARRLTPGSTASTAIPGLSTWCNSLLAAGPSLYCGIGGDARYGVSSYGVKQLPLAGGASTWLKTYLNYPHLASTGTFVFYVGTTDNQYSFANLGAVDTNDNTDQVVVSGGALDSSFVMTDADAYYFVRHDTAPTSTLVRTRFDAAQGVDLITGDGVFTDTTYSTGADVFTITTVGGVAGLWKVPVASPSARQLVLAKSDMGQSTYGPSHLHGFGAGWVFVSGASVYRAFVPGH